ncbi:type II toxin-antitoxin system RelE/ParE family toxin [Pseudidiomarina terrestris]|uniref:type II toxin-antitoxin system RelE/ParE family toxin n=1 Tax=Pseudidiomarina terrestris TaxID=2820060 RepID=UPI00265638DA|nr:MULTISPECIES: type II toxin-antitoxin system RelE/ParE family toxin [unclassified Pseudidiomarina]MDN7134922.1 type II toxin-antitoxin system RelE/ParE family toxin [Pseudidiomarina sp. 1ASP75-5]MDN7137601.1 type II toxin-antitoxin system RelE/ParE family toxin [Pseudidiomarina sp. 1ASP75-14]
MILTIKHKGLAEFYRTGSTAGIQYKHAARLRMQLVALDTALFITDLQLPGYRLHRLKGESSHRWSIKVSGNWRLTFEFRAGNVYLLNYEDYH